MESDMTIDIFLASMAAIGIAAVMILMLTRKSGAYTDTREAHVRTRTHARQQGNHRQ